MEPPEADSVPVYTLEPLVVGGRVDDLAGLVPTASVGYVGRQDLRLRPLLREGELLETVPGMILTQHSGDGKANQFFVRGFNLDHGTDFLTRVEGMPVNLRSHAHSHGYTDLNFIVPELVDHVEYKLGNYYADVGDFGTAGSAHFRLRDRLEGPLFSAGLGEGGFQRLVAAGSADTGSGALLAGGELKRYDGPWERGEDLRKLAGVLRHSWQEGDDVFALTGLAYANRWNGADQIPARAVEAGVISRFGQIDGTLRGESSRFSLSGSWSRAGADSGQRVEAYAIRYELDLLQNFTYFLDDPVMGDQLRQRDRGRWVLGANLADLRSFRAAGKDHDLTTGLDLRGDASDVTVLRSSAGADISAIRSDRVKQGSVSGYLELASEWSDHFRTVWGLRGDLVGSDISGDLAANSGTARDAIVSPKLSLAVGPWVGTELYGSAGLGFHSNDGRGSVITVDPVSGAPVEPVDPLVRSLGAEIGLRSTPLPGWRATFALWTVELDSELVFVGDAGTTEPGDASRRVGVTLANFYRFGDRVTADLDVSFTRARHRDVPADANRVLGAIERVVAAGITWEPGVNGGPYAAVRLRHLGPYPLVEDNSLRSRPTSLLNLNVGHQHGAVRFGVSVLNALDSDRADIEYFYESRLITEAAPVEGIHFRPVEPRQLRFTVTVGS